MFLGFDSQMQKRFQPQVLAQGFTVPRLSLQKNSSNLSFQFPGQVSPRHGRDVEAESSLATLHHRVFILFFHNELGGGLKACTAAKKMMESALAVLQSAAPVPVPALLLEADTASAVSEVPELPFASVLRLNQGILRGTGRAGLFFMRNSNSTPFSTHFRLLVRN